MMFGGKFFIIMKKYYFLSVFIFVFFAFFKIVHASGIGISISPVKMEDIVDPGETITKYITVTNNTNLEKTFYVYLKDFKADGENGAPKLIAPGSEKGYYLASWIEITKDPIRFAPYEEKNIPFKINVPKETGPGGYYGAVYFGTKPPKLDIEGEDKGAGMAIGQQTGSLILLQVSGDVVENAVIREFSTDQEVYGTPFDVKFMIRIQNLGNVHVKPLGTIKITNMFGKEVAKITVNAKGGNVLPNSVRKFYQEWKDKYGFGKYRAEIGLSYGTPASKGGKGKQSMFSVIGFWIIPWNIVVPSLIGLISLVVLLILFLRFYKNKAIRRAMEQAGIASARTRYIRKPQGPSPTAHLAMILTVVLLVVFLIIGAVYLLFFS